jgi:hypothetical protein
MALPYYMIFGVAIIATPRSFSIFHRRTPSYEGKKQIDAFARSKIDFVSKEQRNVLKRCLRLTTLASLWHSSLGDERAIQLLFTP